jgi:hypothetical protein
MPPCTWVAGCCKQEFINVTGGIEIGDQMAFSPGTAINEIVTIIFFFIGEAILFGGVIIEESFVDIVFDPPLANMHPKNATVVVLPEPLL